MVVTLQSLSKGLHRIIFTLYVNTSRQLPEPPRHLRLGEAPGPAVPQLALVAVPASPLKSGALTGGALFVSPALLCPWARVAGGARTPARRPISVNAATTEKRATGEEKRDLSVCMAKGEWLVIETGHEHSLRASSFFLRFKTSGLFWNACA